MSEAQFEKVCKGLEHEMQNRGQCGHYCGEGVETVSCRYDISGLCIQHWGKDALALIRQQQERIKELEHEIIRLKQHVDCDAAEKIPSGCVGYGRGINDDEPCETCKECPEYNLYGVE